MSSKEKEIGPEEIEYKGNNAADFSKGWIYVRKARVLCFKEKPNFKKSLTKQREAELNLLQCKFQQKNQAEPIFYVAEKNKNNAISFRVSTVEKTTTWIKNLKHLKKKIKETEKKDSEKKDSEIKEAEKKESEKKKRYSERKDPEISKDEIHSLTKWKTLVNNIDDLKLKYGKESEPVLEEVIHKLKTYHKEKKKKKVKLKKEVTSPQSSRPLDIPVSYVPKTYTPQDISKITKIQKYWRRRKNKGQTQLETVVTKLLVSEVAQPERNRNAILKEIINSERDYNQKLTQIQQHFKGSQIASDTFSFEQWNQMMKALDNVVIISQGLLKKFLEMEKQWPLKIDLGSVFLEMLPRLAECYHNYTLIYTALFKKVVTKKSIVKKKDLSLKKFMKVIEEENTTLSILIMPVLRMTKYEWIFSRLIECLPENHVDRGILIKVRDELTRINDATEVDRETARNLDKILALNNYHLKNYIPEIVETSKVWIREGPLFQIGISGPEKCYVYLLNDSLVVTQMLPNETKFDKVIKLDKTFIDDLSGSLYTKHGFRLKHKENLGSSSHYFYCSTQQENKSWIEDIKAVMSQLNFSKSRYEHEVTSSQYDVQRLNKIARGSSFNWVLDKHPANRSVSKNAFNIKSLSVKEKPTVHLFTLDGPDTQTDNNFLPDYIYCNSISTYPIVTPPNKRDGDPICDHYHVKVHTDRIYVCIADGCNWGVRPQQAAIRASKAFIEFLDENSDDFKLTNNIASHLTGSAEAAHNAIIKGYENDIWQAGTTTLLGGVLLELEPDNEQIPKWGFIFLSVGDCKAFHWNHKTGEVTDITEGNRGKVTDASDPGGRLGPFTGQGSPDLRNMRVYFYSVNEGDICFVVSDGVHDNFDPRQLGKTPMDFGIQEESWKELELQEQFINGFLISKAEKIQNQYRVNAMASIINKRSQVTPETIVNDLIQYCFEITTLCREFMQANPGAKQPKDYVKYPGKFDHTTCVAFRVGEIKVKEKAHSSNK